MDGNTLAPTLKVRTPMSELPKDLYSASCNPPRRAKRLPIVDSSPYTQSSHARATLPMHPTTPTIVSDVVPASAAAQPVKRGRKPGPLSRSAREAQRRLNHSIIEKARRTKINDALATLRRLVPLHYGSTQHQNEREEENDDDDDEYPEEGAKKGKPKPKPKGTGKREEKEKEFKLEILVRTVAFLQDLLNRVDTMENSLIVCQHCGEIGEPSKKRKHSQVHDDDEDDQTPRKTKVLRNGEEHPSKSVKSHNNSPVPTPELQTNGNGSGARLPSISSWLPNVVIDPSLLPPQNKPKPSVSPNVSPYLPSPPSSTHFDPIRTTQVPPVLNLGPVATAAMVALPRTSEDESAASLLLQIAASPPFRPSSSTNSSYNLPDPSKFMLHSDVRNQRHEQVRQAQTPRSLLGLHQEQKF